MTGSGRPSRSEQDGLNVIALIAAHAYLDRLENKGVIRSEWGVTDNNRRAKFYRLTRMGRKELESETDSWERLSRAVSRVLKAIEQGA